MRQLPCRRVPKISRFMLDILGSLRITTTRVLEITNLNTTTTPTNLTTNKCMEYVPM